MVNIYRTALSQNATGKSTIVPSYVTESGYTEDLSTRTKVGTTQKHTATVCF